MRHRLPPPTKYHPNKANSKDPRPRAIVHALGLGKMKNKTANGTLQTSDHSTYPACSSACARKEYTAENICSSLASSPTQNTKSGLLPRLSLCVLRMVLTTTPLCRRFGTTYSSVNVRPSMFVSSIFVRQCSSVNISSINVRPSTCVRHFLSVNVSFCRGGGG